MGIVETVKDVATLVQKADNIELYQKILELQGQIMGLLEENHSLKSQLRATTERLEFQGAMVFRDNMYFRELPSGEQDGPYCSKCWDVERKAVRHLTLGDGTQYCPGCRRSAPGTRGSRDGESTPPRGRNRFTGY